MKKAIEFQINETYKNEEDKIRIATLTSIVNNYIQAEWISLRHYLLEV